MAPPQENDADVFRGHPPAVAPTGAATIFHIIWRGIVLASAILLKRETRMLVVNLLLRQRIYTVPADRGESHGQSSSEQSGENRRRRRRVDGARRAGLL